MKNILQIKTHEVHRAEIQTCQSFSAFKGGPTPHRAVAPQNQFMG